jgi:hypothetical protein
MYLLDSMECPDYNFEAGFDYNPKSKTRLGNLNWMYDELHNVGHMLPHLEHIELPDPLSNHECDLL